MLFIHKHEKEVGVAFDIGTSSVSAAVFSYVRTMPRRPHMIAVHRIAIDSLSDIHADSLHRTIVKQLKNILGKVHESIGNNVVKHVMLGLTAPFYIASSTKLSHARKNPTVSITQAEIHALLAEGEKKFLASYAQGNTTSIILFTKLLLKTFVNGYRVQRAVGTVGKTLDIAIRYEATTRAFARELMMPVQSLYAGADTHIMTISLAYLYAFRETMHTDDSIMIIDIGGEVTEISIISDGTLEHVISIPAGVSFIVRRIAEALRVPYADARFIIRRFTEQTLETEKTVLVTNIITQAVADWQDAFIREFDSYVAEDALPVRILLTGGGALLSTFRNIFTQAFLERIGMSGTSSVSVARPDGLRDRFEAFSSFGGPEDFALACLVLACTQGDDFPVIPYN